MEFLKEQLKKLPGLSYVFVVASLLLLRGEPKLLQLFFVAFLAWFFYWMGSALKWDDLFDYYYGPEQHPELDKNKKLSDRRRAVASKLHCPITGLYGKSKQLFAKTEQWEDKIKWVLEVSKAARTLLVPCLLIFVYPTHLVSLAQLCLLLAAYFALVLLTARPEWSLVFLFPIALLYLGLRHFVPQMPWYFHFENTCQSLIKEWETVWKLPAFSQLSDFWAHTEIVPERNRIEWLAQNAWVVALIFVVAFSLYFWLRLVHLLRLYALVDKARHYEFDVLDYEGKKRSVLVVNGSVVARKTVLLIGPAKDRCDPGSALYLACQWLQATCGIHVVVCVLHDGNSVAGDQFTKEKLSSFKYKLARRKQSWLPVLRERLRDFASARERDELILPDKHVVQTLADTTALQYRWDLVITIDSVLPDGLKNQLKHDLFCEWIRASDRHAVTLQRMAKEAARELDGESRCTREGTVLKWEHKTYSHSANSTRDQVVYTVEVGDVTYQIARRSDKVEFVVGQNVDCRVDKNQIFVVNDKGKETKYEIVRKA